MLNREIRDQIKVKIGDIILTKLDYSEREYCKLAVVEANS